MSQFPNTSDTLDLLREPAGGNFLRQSAGLAAPMNRFYFDRLGNTTGDRLQPKGGFFGQIGRQLVEGEASLSTLNPVGRGFITSGAEWLAGAFSDRAEAEISVPGPFISDAITKERKFMVDGVPTPAAQVNISDMWRNLPVEARIAMQTAGFDVTTLSNLGIGDAQTFSDRWPDLLNAINSRQLIQDYADKRPIRSGLATATTFGVNIVTDPVVIGTLGAGAVAKVAARSTIRESLKQASARAAVAIGDGPGLSVAKKALLQDRMLAARMLYQPSSVAAGSSYMLTADIASQERNLLYGMGDIEDGVKLSFGTAAVGGLIGLAGSELALRLVGRSHGTITNKVYRDADEINSYAKARVEARMSNSPGFERQGIDWDEVITEEFVEDFAAATYRPDQARRVGQALDDIDLTDDTAHAAVTNYMTKFPTAEELETFVRSGLRDSVETGNIPTTRYEIAKAELDRLIAKRLSVDPASKSARGINAEIGRVQDEISSLLGPELLFRSAGLPERQGLLARQLRAIASELPSTAFTNPNQRRARLTTLFTRLAESAKDGSYNTSALIPYMQKQMNKIGAAIGNPGQRARLFMASEKPTVAMIGRLFNVVSDRPFHRSERITMPDGTELMSTASRRDELDRDIIDPFKIEYINVIQRMTEQERSAFSANVLLAATGKLDDADDITRQVAEFLRSGYDSVGARGERTGYLNSMLDNYVFILLNKEITEEAKDAFIRKWSKTYGERFDSRLNANPEIHYNTLLDLGLVTKAGNRHITIEGVILRADGEEGLPKTLNEMSDEFKADYIATVPDTIANEGRLYLHRHGSKADKKGLYDPELELETDDINGFADPSRLRARGDYVRSDISRKVAQDILLDREILESGLVNLDLAETLDAYMRSTGYNIVRQETLTQLVGEPIRFPEFLAVLRNVAGDDPEARKAVDLIELTDRSQANRLRRDQELSVFTTTVAQVGSAVVNAAMLPLILAFEGGSTIARMAGNGNTRLYVETAANAFARLADSNLARLDGVDSAMESLGRAWSSTADLHMAHDLQTSKWARTSRTGNELVRTVTFERPLTRFLKSMHYDMTYGKLDKYRNKLDRLYGLQMRPDSIEELKGVARQAGIDWRDLDMFQRKGLLNDNVLDGAKHALSMDPKALTNVRRMEWVIANTPPGPVRDNVSDLNRIMRNWAYEDAQALIATPDATSRVTLGDKTPMSNLLQLAFGFTSWAMTFQNRTMARMSNSAPWKQVSFLSYFVAAETMNSVYRDVVTNGKSPEEVSLDWEENGAKKFGAILLRLPQFGIINPLTSAAELALAGGNTQIGGMSNLVSSPVLGMTDRALRATLQGGQQVMNGEPLSDSVKDSVYRLAPGANFWYVTLLRRLRDDFE